MGLFKKKQKDAAVAAPETATPPAETALPGDAANNGKKKKNKAKSRKRRRRIIWGVVALLCVAGLAFGISSLFRDKGEEMTPWTEMVSRGSIQTNVTGSGITRAKDSATLTLSAAGTVQEVYVQEGDKVEAGKLLYIIDSTEAEEAVREAENAVNDLQKQIDAVQKQMAELSVRAEFSGKLVEVGSFRKGDEIGAGQKLATLIDDSTMMLKLYFNYAYDGQVYAGQTAYVSVPALMGQFTGKVKAVHKVEYVSPEGGVFFEAEIAVPNPGSLGEGMSATAVLKASDGTDIYPYAGAELTYADKKEIVATVGGEILSVNLRDFQRVSAGTLLMQISDENCAQDMAAYRTQMRTAQESLQNARERLANFNATAPMSGTVLQCSLVAGEEVAAGSVAVTIADTSVMMVDVQVDEMNVSYVKPGTVCDITQWGREGEQHFTGEVESVSLEGKYENGVSTFPAVIRVENADGALMSGMGVDYSIAASQSDDCLLVPVQAVKYTELGSCIFVRRDRRPDDALDAEELGMDVPDGFFAVPVKVGLSNTSSAEIIEGVEEGEEIFVQYMTNSGESWEEMW